MKSKKDIKYYKIRILIIEIIRSLTIILKVL